MSFLGEDGSRLLSGPGLGRPHSHLPSLGSQARDSPENAVGGSQHPVGVDEGAPTGVHPGGPVVAVDPQADLPRPLPGGALWPPTMPTRSFSGTGAGNNRRRSGSRAPPSCNARSFQALLDEAVSSPS